MNTAPLLNSGDTAWMLISTALVLLMTPGLAFFMAEWCKRETWFPLYFKARSRSAPSEFSGHFSDIRSRFRAIMEV